MEMNISLYGCEWVKKVAKLLLKDAFLTADEDLIG